MTIHHIPQPTPRPPRSASFRNFAGRQHAQTIEKEFKETQRRFSQKSETSV